MNGPAAQTGAQDSGDDVPSKRPHLLFGNVSFTESERSRIQKCLNMKLSGDFISYRPGAGGSEIAYVQQWMVFDIANTAFGFNGWSRSIRTITIDYADKKGSKFEVGVSAIVRVTLKDGAYHEDIGYGNAIMPTRYQAMEKAKKQSVTDGTKRALKMFGQIFGQCLNDKDYQRYIRPHAKKKREATDYSGKIFDPSDLETTTASYIPCSGYSDASPLPGGMTSYKSLDTGRVNRLGLNAVQSGHENVKQYTNFHDADEDKHALRRRLNIELEQIHYTASETDSVNDVFNLNFHTRLRFAEKIEFNTREHTLMKLRNGQPSEDSLNPATASLKKSSSEIIPSDDVCRLHTNSHSGWPAKEKSSSTVGLDKELSKSLSHITETSRSSHIISIDETCNQHDQQKLSGRPPLHRHKSDHDDFLPDASFCD
eukprot:gene7674-601_t